MADFENAKIEFDCPSCLRTVRAPREQIGSRIVCPHCQRSLVVPVAGKEDLFGDLLEPDTKPSNPNPSPIEALTQPEKIANERKPDELEPSNNLDSLDEFQFEIPSADEVHDFLRNNLEPIDQINTSDDVNSDNDVNSVNDINSNNDDDPLTQSLLAGLDDIAFSRTDSPVNANDPFDNDPQAPLKIDGISNPTGMQGTITVICPICDTRIMVGADQESERIKCPECYAEIVAKARISRKNTYWSKPENDADGNDDSQQKSTHSSRPQTPASGNQKAFGIDGDDIKSTKSDRVFENHEETLEGNPLAPIAIPTQPHPRFSASGTKHPTSDDENNSDDELQLAPLDERDIVTEPTVAIEDDPFRILDDEPDGLQSDAAPTSLENQDDEYKLSAAEPLLLEPSAAPSQPSRTAHWDDLPPLEDEVVDVEELPNPAQTQSANSQNSQNQPTPKPASPGDAERSQAKHTQYQAPPTTYVDPEEERLKNNPLSMELSSLMGMDGKALQWLSRILGNIQLVIRLGLALAALTFGYWMFDIIAGAASLPEATVASVSVYFVICGLPGFVAFVFGWMLTLAIAGVVFERSGNLKPDIEDWPDLSFGEYLPKIIFMLFSLWIAAIPGSFIGLVLLAISKEPVWLVVTGSLSAMLISPLFFFSAFYNGSSFKIISTKALAYFKMSNTDWLLFVPPSFLSWLVFILGTVLLFLPTVIFCFVGAALQILAVTTFATFAGVYAGLMVERIELTEARREQERAVADRVRTKKKETP